MKFINNVISNLIYFIEYIKLLSIGCLYEYNYYWDNMLTSLLKNPNISQIDKTSVIIDGVRIEILSYPILYGMPYQNGNHIYMSIRPSYKNLIKLKKVVKEYKESDPQNLENMIRGHK